MAKIKPEDERLVEYAQFLGSSSVGLIPTLTLYCIELPSLDNPWKEAVAGIFNPQDINFPVDSVTGKHNFEPETQKEMVQEAESTLQREKMYFQAGARYLAGSGTDVFGALPGISLHTELELLTKIGLSERQALAAATSNFAEIFNWKEAGQLRPGCRADILIVNKNPLINIKSLKDIHIVILGGEIVNRKKLLEPNLKNST